MKNKKNYCVIEHLDSGEILGCLGPKDLKNAIETAIKIVLDSCTSDDLDEKGYETMEDLAKDLKRIFKKEMSFSGFNWMVSIKEME